MIADGESAGCVSRLSELYGHAEILRQYAGVYDSRLRLLGQVQHGWSVGAGVDPEPLPIRVWGERSLAALDFAGVKATAIGAPYLYLPRQPTLAEIGGFVEKSLLAFPEHSTPGYPCEPSYWVAYAAWLESVRHELDLSQTTVCLHANDYDDAFVCHVLKRHGHTIACCGLASSARVSYLDRLRAFILQHGIVTANAVGSSIFYAAYESKPVFVGGPAPQRKPVSPHVTEVWHAKTHDPAWIDAEFPGLRSFAREAQPLPELGARELGLSFKQAPAQLWQTLSFAIL